MDTGNALVVSAVDKVMATQFVLPFRTTFNRVSTRLAVQGGAGKKYGVALYNVAEELIVESGALDANTIQTNETTLTLTTLEPGVYWFAQTADTSTVQMIGLKTTGLSTALRLLTSPRMGNTNNTAPAPGTFPATLGGVTNANPRDPIASIFTRE